MKIGILTQPLESNYGGILQNFALQVVLRKLGHDPVTLRTGKHSIKNWCIGTVKIAIKKIIGRKTKFKPYPAIYEKRKAGIEEFIRTHIKCTSKINWYDKDLIDRYSLDALVVGSDKVWAFWQIEDMFFDFAKECDILKFAYAASFGTNKWVIDEQKTARCRELVQSFSGVSVREHSGVKLCKENLGIKAQWVLDPTMLLYDYEYFDLCKNVLPQKGPFLFAYILDLNKEKKQFIHAIAEREHLEPIIVRAESKVSADDTVEKWLALYRDADFVITDSFHGTIFSILFHKTFVSLINQERGADRFESLRLLFNLEKNICDRIPPIEQVPKVNWNLVDDLLAKKRIESMEFIKKSLSNN